MCEGSHRGLKSRRENFVEFFGEEEVVGIDEASECLSEAESLLIRGEPAIVVRDVLPLVFPTGDEGQVEDWSVMWLW